MTPRHYLAAIAAGALLSACTTTDESPKVDDALMSLENRMVAAQDFAALTGLGAEAMALSSAARAQGEDSKALARASASIRAYEAASYVPGLAGTDFLSARTNALSAALSAWEICETGAPDPQLGNQCAQAAAVKRINDSVIASRVLENAARKADWQGAEQAAKSFTSSVGNSWPAYEGDIAVLANSELDETPFKEMKGRSACNLQRGQGLAGLMTQHAANPAATGARHAYLEAAASASAHLGIPPQGEACTTEGEESLKCKGARERGLAMWCDRFNSDPDA